MSDRNVRKRQRLDILESQMRDTRISFKSTWRDLSENILPRRSRFFISDVNRGERKNLKIIDSTATLASRTLASGMMTGITSPARDWFKLNIKEKELKESENVKQYLADVSSSLKDVFLRSNLYNVLPTLYGDLGTFATGCIFMEEDLDEVVNFLCFPIGTYMIANDKKGKVRVFFREFQMSVRQIVDMFGRRNPEDPKSIDWTNISESVKNHYERHQMETMIDISHIIKPNEFYKEESLDPKFKKYASSYYERGVSPSSEQSAPSSQTPHKFLRESGYDFFPVLAVRWEVVGEDTYGTGCPGMVAIGDVKQLQLGEKRIAAAVDQKVKPSMVGPTSLRKAKASILPGDITYLDEAQGSGGFRRLFEMDFDVRELEGKQDQVRQRISRAYYEDLFLMLANSDRRQITAREVEERHEEKLMALGPVLERINQDLLDPLIENTFNIMDKAGLLPPTPEELQGREYSIEYVSIMAQAQKLSGIGGIERLTGFVGSLAALDPSAIQKLNIEEIIEQYADLVGVTPNLLITKEQMADIQEAQAEAAQAEQDQIQATQMVDSAKTLSETPMDEDTALQEVLGGAVG